VENNSVLPVWILVLPLLGFLLNGVFYPLAAGSTQSVPNRLAGFTATFLMMVGFVLGLLSLNAVSSHGALVSHVFQWLEVGTFKFQFDLVIDRLSAVMVLIITGVGSLIHLYSIGYMEHEQGGSRFFAYLNLFCFSMLMLVLSDNLLFLFFGWEGVGLCSFLLIGYWYHEAANGDAARKAFIVNRIGDVAFVLGLFLILWRFGTLSVSELSNQLPTFLAEPGTTGLISLIGGITLLLFVGATGKSAQVPLYVWLPDAMAGPTPVSALIHAATMVTAGVYLLARLSFFYVLAPDTMQVIAWVGGITALLGGCIGLQQNDIKKVLAYSTVSQLGMMFMAAGVGAYKTAVFHLMTHAFFKALLFLGSGSVIHALNGEQDMRKMGGLRRHLPITYVTMLIGSASLMGLPFFCGFFSKDGILFAMKTLPAGSTSLWIVGLFAAFLTACYTSRMIIMTFFGNENFKKALPEVHPHESPWTMSLPLVILATLALLSGFLAVPHELAESFGLHIKPFFMDWLTPVLSGAEFASHSMSEMTATFIAVMVSFGGVIVGILLFTKNIELPWGRKILEEKFYVDEIYQKIFVQPLHLIARSISVIVENIVQGIAELVLFTCQWTASKVRTVQSGDLQGASFMLAGGILLLTLILYFW